MKFVVRSFQLKNSNPVKKSAKPKAVSKKVNKKSVGGVRDNRKYINDSTLSEAEKISRRIALEKMKRNGNLNKNKKQLFLKDNENDNLEEDNFFIKAKQIDGLDEGLDESSEDEPTEQDTEKYFSNTKKTLADKIHESKIERNEKTEQNTADVDFTIEANKKFRDEIRFKLPKLAAKLISKTVPTNSKFDYNSIFQKNFETLIYAERPQKVDLKTINVKPLSEKENDKLVEMKIKKLRDRLVKEGIQNKDENGIETESDLSNKEDEEVSNEGSEGEEISNEESDGEELSNEESDGEDISNEGSDGEEISNEGSDGEELSNEEISNEGSDGEDISNERSDGEEISNEGSDGEEISNEESEGESSGFEGDIKEPLDNNANPKEALESLKEIITKSSKCNKRKLEDANEDKDTKRMRSEIRKTEYDCFRVIMEMPEYKKDVLNVLSNQMNPFGVKEDDYKKKLILAILLQEVLKKNIPNCYSPELIVMIKFLCECSTAESTTWLSIKSDLTHVTSDKIMRISDSPNSEKSLDAISMLYHILNLLISVISINRDIANRHSLFGKFLPIFQQFPTQLYPDWLREKLNEVTHQIEVILSEPIPILRMRKNMKIVELLEPDLEEDFDRSKNITKSLKNNIKKERKSIKKVMKLNAKEAFVREVEEDRKLSKFRNEKTKEILNSIRQK